MNDALSRRTFVVGTTLAAGAIGLPSVLRAQGNMNKARRLKTLIQPVDFSQITIKDSFWRPKQEKVATATLAACILQTEQKTGRIRNFEKAARRAGEHEGIWFDDSDVYKALEAMAYSLKNRPDAALERKADEWIDKIAAAQLPDGYLNTYYTLVGLDQRWTDMDKHEDYCAGHLIEAAIAYYRITGKRKLLDVSIRFADYLDATFRVPNRPWVSGHQEIELALMKLYHLTGTERYLQLAQWYLDQRGHGHGKGMLWGEGKDPGYCQDVVPVKDQREITGHAVRAMYLYSGAADVGAVTGDAGYMRAMKAVWEDVVHRNMYVTGGIGSAGANEGFSQDYDLPNAEAYCETCASVGMVFWNQRMAFLTGESQYIDVLEKSLYNGALDGLSLSADRFFYANRLASSTAFPADAFFGRGRREWFGTACCPSNIARLVASLGSYIYGISDEALWVNLFVSSKTKLNVGGSEIDLDVETNYPWDGAVKIALNPARPARCAVHLRIPGWARGVAVPGDLYRFINPVEEKIAILVNGKPARYRDEKGYAVIDRTWRPGDVIQLQLPMSARQIIARDEVKANRNRTALQRGPLVYCVEGSDNSGHVWNLVVPADAGFEAQPHQVLDEAVVALRGEVSAVEPATDGSSLELKRRPVVAIPYYTWANRDNYEMQVWLPTRIEDITINART